MWFRVLLTLPYHASGPTARNPVALVVTGFPFIHAGFKIFRTDYFDRNEARNDGTKTTDNTTFYIRIYIRNTDSIRSRFFYSSHHHTVSYRTLAVCASS